MVALLALITAVFLYLVVSQKIAKFFYEKGFSWDEAYDIEAGILFIFTIAALSLLMLYNPMGLP